MDNFNEEGDEQLEGEQDDDEYQEMVAEMSVLQEDDTALPEPAEAHMAVQETDCVSVVWRHLTNNAP